MRPYIIIITILLLFIPDTNCLNANKIDEYFFKYRTTGITEYAIEKEIIESYKLNRLIEQLAPFYTDSLVIVRQKAYFLTYKKGIREQSNKNSIAVNQLLKGCSDENGSIIGQNIDYLQEFSPEAFDSEAKNKIQDLLSKRQIIHLKKTAMLAGYAGAANEIMQQQLLLPDISKEKKWALSLALARQGNMECIEFCINSIKKIPLSNDLVYYVMPDLIYMRQKAATDYCIEILNSNEKLCVSADPDKGEKILCGYYLLELITPVIVNFPLKTDGTGSLVSNDYESALIAARSWFKTNPEYTLKKEIF